MEWTIDPTTTTLVPMCTLEDATSKTSAISCNTLWEHHHYAVVTTGHCREFCSNQLPRPSAGLALSHANDPTLECRMERTQRQISSYQPNTEKAFCTGAGLPTNWKIWAQTGGRTSPVGWTYYHLTVSVPPNELDGKYLSISRTELLGSWKTMTFVRADHTILQCFKV